MTKKLWFLLALLPSVAAIAVPPAPKPLPTNFVQNINLQLMVSAPGIATKTGHTVSNVTLVTKDALKAIGAASGFNLSAKAKMVAVTSITYYTNLNKTVFGYLGNTTFQIRDGTNIIDVTPFFNIATLNSNTYIASYTQANTGAYTAFKNYRLRSITVSNPGLSFTGQGFVESPLVNVSPKPGVTIFGIDDIWTSFTGIATQGAVTGILQGTINAIYSHVE
jgi:hypothetical protein